MANVDHHEGVFVCSSFDYRSIACQCPFGSGPGAYQIGSSIGRCSINCDCDHSGHVQRFITSKLEVIRTGFMLHVQHIPHLVGHVDPDFQDQG